MSRAQRPRPASGNSLYVYVYDYEACVQSKEPIRPLRGLQGLWFNLSVCFLSMFATVALTFDLYSRRIFYLFGDLPHVIVDFRIFLLLLLMRS